MAIIKRHNVFISYYHEQYQVYVATDLDNFPGFFREDGMSNFWMATLLDKITYGEIPKYDTAHATMIEKPTSVNRLD